jgi:glycosyltransferase involved in cell wall biosynthesis
MISISDAQRGPLPQARWIGPVYHGIPEDLFVPNLVPEGYLAFLGRIAPEKGPEAAIHLARAAGLPLKIAAKVDKADREYFKERVEPLIDGDQIQHVGEIDERQNRRSWATRLRSCFPSVGPSRSGSSWSRPWLAVAR